MMLKAGLTRLLASALIPATRGFVTTGLTSAVRPYTVHHISASPAQAESATSLTSAVGTAPLDWENLGFEYRTTKSHIKFVCKDGQWGEGELVSDPYIKVHIANTGLHYGQAVFEGMKAFHTKDGDVKIFRPYENAERISRSAGRILMEAPPAEMFVEGCKKVIRDNMEYVPPYGSDGALYIRPLLFGSGPRIGLQPADEYTLLIMVMPVGNYYKGGMKPTTAVVVEDYDRAAPKGVGSAKVAGNYAADMLPNMEAKKAGYPIGLYLDAKTNSLIEEFSTSNFFGITRDGSYVTPASPAVLASITNKSLMELAAANGMKVERRDVPLEELDSFVEVAACGTAVVMTAVKRVVTSEKVYEIGSGEEVGEVCQKLYKQVRGIQNGEVEDTMNWMESVTH
ncbi:unnamed protein product [Chrysoparadoxa australica]